MAEYHDIPAWIALFMGLYALSASIGEFFNPGYWARLIEGLETNTALGFLTGIVCIATGGLIYLASPWNPADWLSILVTVMGGGMAIEGCVMLAFPGPFARMARAMLTTASGRGWAAFSALMGAALIAVALVRL
ncbi:hypothetical protein [Altererythrobacter sp.]|uniref:hypothetical protein n=1 Tax=Altererythrobacter sp. TaxID=1872480 RepID=UPI003D046261